MEPYTTSTQHLFAELERVDLLVRLQVWRARQLKATDDRFEGLYITEREIDTILSGPAGLPRWTKVPSPWSEPTLERVLARLSDVIAARKALARERGLVLALDRLAQTFALDTFDLDVLLICLALELDLRYERLFAYLQDDVSRRRPSVDLLLNLLCPSFELKLSRRSRFITGAPLVDHRLVEIADDPSRPSSPLLGTLVTIDPRIANFILGTGGIDSRLAPFARLERPVAAELPVGPPTLVRRIEALAAADHDAGLLLHLRGPRGSGKKSWAAVLASRVGVDLLLIDGARAKVAATDNANLVELARLAAREASLAGAALCWHGFDALLGDEHEGVRQEVVHALAARGGLNILAGASFWEPERPLARASFASLEVPRPTATERVLLLRRGLGAMESADLAAELPAIASKFRLTGGELLTAVEGARSRARWRGHSSRVSSEDLHAACRAQSTRNLGALARTIRPHYTFTDIILPEDAKRQIREICERARHRARVFEDWGFDDKLSLGKGLAAMFSGPSGTGKTMAAEIVASELQLELIKVDLSGVVSKYIGETEKNLARVFDDAESSNAVLFFDEADALFGKRSEVKDAHDRHANVETSFLLQRMEEYEGITILATNLRRNLDDAFVRRMAFVVQFPFPEEDDRLRIWQGVWPHATPRVEDLDLAFMARQFKFSGGNIKNVALAAAFLAASDDEPVGMAHVIRAARRELQKTGQSLVASQFGPYAALLDD